MTLLRSGDANASSPPRVSARVFLQELPGCDPLITIPWPGGFLRGVVDGFRDTAAAEWMEELGVLNKLLKACSDDCA